MRILQLGKFYPIKGGVEKVMYDLTKGLSESGINCDMLCANHHSGIERINDYSNLIFCHTWVKIAGTTIAPRMIYELRKRAADYDIIHVHHPDPMACLALMCSGFKGKVVLHWHSDIVRQKRFLKLYYPMQQWLLRRADIIVGTTPKYVAESPYLQNVLHKVDTMPIGVINMAPTDAGATKIREAYGNRKIIFSLGRLVPYKGFAYLVEAALYLPDDYVILIGGEGPLRAELQGQINRGNLSSKVKLLGRIPDNEVADYYGACTAFCLSSIQKTEAFGIVQIEAMSCGKPIIATRIPESGVAWVNEDGVSGLNTSPCDARALANAIIEVTADKERYTRYCHGASERFKSIFTRDEMIDNCMKIYALL